MAKLDVKYQPVTSQNRIPLVQNGTVDLECGSTTNNAARQKDVAFAVTTYVEEVRIVVKANSRHHRHRRPQRQDGRHHHRHDVGADAAQERARRQHGLQGSLRQGPRRQLPAARIRPRRRVRDGRPDPRRPLAKAKNPADFKIVGEVLSVEPIACMMRKDDPAFKKAVDDSIMAMIKSGELAKMYDKWFVQPIPPANTKVGLPLSRRHQGGVGQPERQADGRVREAVIATHGGAWHAACPCCESAATDHRVALFLTRWQVYAGSRIG